MSLRDQPYLPLYVQDFLTDEKLIECSACSTGIYIRLLCIMHKSDPYGMILLKQKDKQTDKQIKNFASKLAKQMPYQIDEIESGLNELISEGVLILEDEKLLQKRMIKDNNISSKRSEAGKIGGTKTQFAKAKVKAKRQSKHKANTEYEYEDENVIEDKNKEKEEKFKSEVWQFLKLYPETMLKEFISYWTEPNKSKSKLRFELEKTWDLTRRLNTWAKNDKVFKKAEPQKEVYRRKEINIKNDPENSTEMPEYLKKLAQAKTIKL